MSKKKVFISGVSGFLGYELANKCLAEGYEVGGLIRQHPQDNEAIKNLRGKVWLYDGDITDSTRLGNILREFSPSIIVHLAALTRVSYSFGHEEETMQTNLGGTVRLISNARKYCPNLEKFIYASSMEAYGHQPEYHKQFKPFDEQTTLGVGSPYGVWKVAGDYFIRQQHYANDFPALCLRQTNTYGRTMDDYFVVEAFVTAMLKNKDVVNFGNPEPMRNFMHVDDLINLYITLFKSNNKEILGKSFTVGPPNAISIKELAEMIAKKLNWKGKINWYTREIRDGEIYYLNSSNDYITKLTGWEPKISLDEGLDRTIKYWMEKLK